MIKKQFLALMVLFSSSVLSVGLFSCSSDKDEKEEIKEKEKEVTEVKLPNGSEDVFAKGMDFESAAGEKTLVFTTNVSWAITVADSRDGEKWCTVSPSNGIAGTNLVTIKVNENQNSEDRNTVLTLVANDVVKTITINQKHSDALTVTTDKFEVPKEGGSIEIEVKSNIDYDVLVPDEYQKWIHQAGTRALTTRTISFTIDESEEYDKREGKIIIRGKGKEEIVSIYQAGGGILTLTQNEFSVNSSEQEIKVEISSNFDYDVEMPNVDWIKENNTGTRGISSHTLSLIISENTNYDSRNAKIKIFDKNSSLSEMVSISQSAKEALIVDNKEFNLDENGGIISVNVNTNINYTVKCNFDWIGENKTRALSSYSHSFYVSPLGENNDREGIIEFTDENNTISEKVVVKQTRALSLDNKSLTLMIGGSRQLTVTNKTNQTVSWESSDVSVASVDNTGLVTAKAKGKATITVKTADGNHSCTCAVTVSDITDMVSAYCSGGSFMQSNNLLLYGSKMNWTFSNGSPEKIVLNSLQLIDGETMKEGNIMPVNKELEAGESVGYSVSVGLAGIHIPVYCVFRFTYKGKEYNISATYQGSNWW